ncbi:alpha 1,2-mannosyltransferase 2.4.1 [Perkinsus olseni]|uniref:Alpha 1,2-mannosyltransferase 2.4.1 n=1 Tax=Perkinsus olseni TaxID=32597 RepID=A0A7J6MCJ9_PEROL|nr:alpha 1,2-mannosyltransferase 2.4.1 [Perkinsus olseni]
MVFCDLSEAKPVYNSTAFGMMLRKQHSVALRFMEEYYEKSSYPPYEVPDFVRMHQLRWTAASIVSKIFDPMRAAAAKGDDPTIDVSELLGDLTKNGLPPDEVAASLNALSTTTESEKLSEVLSILLDTASSYANGNNSEIISTFFTSWRELDQDEREERLIDYFALVHDASNEVVSEGEDRSLSEARAKTSSQEADVLYVSPAITNCQSMGGVLRGVAAEAGGKKPKVILATVNPLIPPPVDIRPQPPSIQQETSDPSVFLNAQCSVSGQDSVMASRGYSLLKMRGAYVWYVRKDIYQTLFQPRTSHKRSPASLHAAWLVGWFCNPSSRYSYGGLMHQSCILGLDSYASLSSGGSGVAPINTAFCEYLSSRGVAVEVGCEGTNLPGAAADEDGGLVDREAQGGHLLRGKRGWGNDKHTQSSAVDSVQECASYCASLKGCQFWTFDDTAMYGAQMCWAWTKGYPDEVRDEDNGWASMNWTDFTASARSGREKAYSPDSPDPSPWAYFPIREMIGQSSLAMVLLDSYLEDRWFPLVTSITVSRAVAPSSTCVGRLRRSSDGENSFINCQICIDTSSTLADMPSHHLDEDDASTRQANVNVFPHTEGCRYCSIIDRGLGLDRERPYRGVLHYLTSNLTSDVSDLNHSLPILYRWNRRYDYPIVVFHDGLSTDQMELLAKASSNRVWFAYVEGYLDLPKWITEDTKYKAMLPEVKWSLGYRGMCKFRSGPIFDQPVLKAFDYMMTLDTDGYLPDDLAYDPIQQMYEGDYVYSYSHTLNDQPAAVQHFWDHTLEYMVQRGIEPLGTELLREFIDQISLEWTYRLFMNDIEVMRLGWFRSAQYMDYYNYLDSQGGWWLYRWGDHAVRTMAVAMWLDKRQLMHMDIPYGHQSFCRCASPERICVRNSDMGLYPREWFTCVSLD